MAARKAASISGSRGITSSTRKALDRLPIHKRRYVQRRAEGATTVEAATSAGVSGRMGRKYDKEADIQAAYRELVRDAIPAKKLATLIKGGCEAKTPVYGPDGRKRGDRADWKTRKGYIEIAAKHGGYHEDKAASGGGVAINLTVNHIGQPDSGASVNGQRSQRIFEATAETV